jgi:hypothetical protein
MTEYTSQDRGEHSNNMKLSYVNVGSKVHIGLTIFFRKPEVFNF